MGISLLLTLGFAWVFVYLVKIGSREAGLPPGPPTLPLLGNLHIFPNKFPHHKFTEWARKYGGIYSASRFKRTDIEVQLFTHCQLKMGSGTLVVLTDPAAVKELMDKRSSSTVDRPPMYIADLVTGGLNLALARHTEKWRSLRRAAHAILTPQATALHMPIQQAEASQLLHDILCHPEGFYTHIRRYSNSVIVSVLYGKRAPRYETPETTTFFNVMHEWIRLLEPGATPPVDFIPMLKYVPERWAKWKRDCAKTRMHQRDLYFGLLDETKDRVRRGDENGSYMEEILRRQEEFGMDWEMTGYLGGALIEGASHTTSAYLQTLILALVAYPDAQMKAQEEIDRVVGGHRMSTLTDLEEMPYIRAMILETHRFRPVTPLLAPHRSLKAEEYKGFLIPQGSTIFVNAWGIFHDPELYDDPESFIPDRYVLSENGTKPGVNCNDLRPNLMYGVGRRMCAGIHLAQASININVMNLVWAFNFSTDTDSQGNPIKLNTFDYEQGITSAPRAFKCKITPRSAEKAAIISREFHDASDTFSKFEFGLTADDKEFVARSRANT
ncbi:cytochrome P450 [Mycena galopus ATCC 62051]|nr:cytochrome P450 [Mycena galopus ATCC 62051]